MIDHAPPWAKQAFGPAATWADMLFVDHGVFRLAYLNQHRLGDSAWRSAQPAPHQLRQAARRGVRTIVNLRGPRSCGSYWLEQAACARYGLKLVDFQVRSRAAPSKAELLAARDLFRTVEYPILMHCKSGADRAGLMSVLYAYCVLGLPIAEAKKQLSWRYGHIRQADTGVLDAFFERYLADNARLPIDFWEWVERIYDPDELKATFMSNGWANRLVNGVLQRE
jgi:protein tyrosine/serine phosphatase